MEKIIGDCMEKMDNLSPVDLIVTDPPYNIGWRYSDKVNDKKKDYRLWCLNWAEQCYTLLKDNGVMCIINYPENNNLLHADLAEMGIYPMQQLIWHYPTNIGQSKRKYTRSYRTILIYTKGDNFTFNQQKGTYKNPTDKRIKERIKQGHAPAHYDVLPINLCKNISKEKKNIGINQLPEALCEFLIKSYSIPGHRVLDPFAGNFTVPRVADALQRQGIGIDINDYDCIKV